MKTRNRIALYVTSMFAIAGLILAACAPAKPAQQPTQDVGAIVASTLAAMTIESIESMQAPPLPSATVVPAATQELPTLAVTTAAGCTDNAELISEDPADNTVFQPGDKIAKRWTLKNIGTCVWDNYRFEFDGKEMGGNSSTPVNQVAPGQSIDLYAYAHAPLVAGTYKGGATMFNRTGGKVTVTYQGLPYEGVSVQIVVKGQANGSVTNAVVDISFEPGAGKVCTDTAAYTVTLSITTDGPVSVTYMLYLTDPSGQTADGTFSSSGSPQSKATLPIYSAETQTFTFPVVGPYSYPDGVTVRVNVNGQSWASNTVVCQ